MYFKIIFFFSFAGDEHEGSFISCMTDGKISGSKILSMDRGTKTYMLWSTTGISTFTCII